MAMPETPQGNLPAELDAKKQNIDEYKNATAAPTPAAPKAASTLAVDKVNTPAKARFGARSGEQRINPAELKDMTKPLGSKPLGSYAKGTSHVPKTGIYKLHEGEAVIPKDKNMDSIKDKMTEALGGSDKKPKKEIKEIRTRKGKSGGYIHEHHHTHPEHHSMEEHTSKDAAAMHDHMEEHMGEANPGEAEADAGQHGIPEAQAEPAGIPAAPAAGAPPMQGAQ